MSVSEEEWSAVEALTIARACVRLLSEMGDVPELAEARRQASLAVIRLQDAVEVE